MAVWYYIEMISLRSNWLSGLFKMLETICEINTMTRTKNGWGWASVRLPARDRKVDETLKERGISG